MCSTCIIGFWASVKLMDEASVHPKLAARLPQALVALRNSFGDTLKPLVLAVMLAGCLEKAVELCAGPSAAVTRQNKKRLRSSQVSSASTGRAARAALGSRSSF